MGEQSGMCRANQSRQRISAAMVLSILSLFCIGSLGVDQVIAADLTELTSATSSDTTSRINFNLEKADIGVVITTVAEFTKKNFIIDPRVKGKVTVLSPGTMTREEVYQTFLSLLEVHGFAAIPSGKNLVKIMPEVDAKHAGGKSSSRVASDEVMTRVFQVKHVSAPKLVPILRPLVPQQGHLAAYAPTNVLIISDRVANIQRLTRIINRVDIETSSDIEVYTLKHASAAELVRILERLQKRGGSGPHSGAIAASGVRLVADERSNSIVMSGNQTDRLSLRGIIMHLDMPIENVGNTQVFYLKYALAKDLVPVLTGLGQSYEKELKAGGKNTTQQSRASITIQAHESTNALVITASQDLLRSMAAVIQKLDIRRAQVHIEVVVAEMSESRSKELGVQWLLSGGSNGEGPIGGVGFGNTNITSAAGTIFGADDGTSLALPGFTGALLGLGDFTGKHLRFAALINALEGDGDTNILSKPSIVTLDNEEAEIVVGQNVPFVTGSYSGTGNNNNPTNPFQTINREDVGISLKVKPQINEGNAIQLEIEQKVDSVAPSDLGAADLITNTRSVRTTVLVDDGGMVVLGGLMKDDLKELEQKVPLLGDIPIIGELFRYRSTSKQKTNLMLFIRPRILRDPAITNDLTSGKYRQIRQSQIEARAEGVGLMEDDVAPVLPEYDRFLDGEVREGFQR